MPDSSPVAGRDAVDEARGSAFAAGVEHEAGARAKAKSIKPLGRLAPFILRYPGLLAGFVFFLIAASALTLAMPAAFRLLVDCGFAGAGSGAACARFSLSEDLAGYIRSLDPTQLRAAVSVVQQNAPLFSGDAIANIRYGRPDARDEEVIAAAQAANAHEFLSALPEGYATPLGANATALSGGQRQRLAIARAILRNAPILLLDEATSALDSESERAIQDAFERISQNRTTLVIAHRLSTVLKADKIVVMDEGRIVDQGTHRELMARGGLYARLAELQFNAERLAAE